jgi:hypothetical protein
MVDGRPPRIDDDQLVSTVYDLTTESEHGWCKTTDVAGELPLSDSAVLKRLKKADGDDNLTVEGWKPFARGGYLWRVDNNS